MNQNTAVILLNYNSLQFLKDFLPKLVEYTQDSATIYLIDNASIDDSVAFVQQEFPQIKCILLPENLGYAGGYAEGLKEVAEDYWVLLNTDVEVSEAWLSPLINRLKNDETIAAVQPKIKSQTNKQLFEHAGAAGGFLDNLGYPFCRGRVFNNIETDTGQYDDSIPIFWASGACLAIKKTAYEKAGGFDPRFFMHMEEIDLCWRLQECGYNIYYEPNSTVYHVGGGGLDYENPLKLYYNFRNNLICLKKNLGFWSFLFKFILRIGFDSVAILRELVKGKWRHSLAIFHAYFSFLIGFFAWNKQYTIANKGISLNLKPYSIVVQYFLKNHKTYTSLPNESMHRRS